MTKNQPVHYIDILKKKLQERKVLVFLVPGWRKKEIETILSPYSTKNTDIVFRVCTWDDLATLLTNSFDGSELIKEFTRDVLRRCRVQAPLKLGDLKDASKVLVQWLSQRELLEKIRDRLQDEPLFKGMQFPLERKPEWDKEHCYMGITIAPPNALSEKDWVGWIGFWNLFQRKNDMETPLFAHVCDTKLARSLLPQFLSSLNVLQAANTVAPYVDGHGLPVPIPIRILEDCKSVQEQAKNIVAYTVGVFSGGTSATLQKALTA